jgi:hypothetical protein
MTNPSHRPAPALLAGLLLALLLSPCGGSSSGGSNPATAGTGSVALALTDAPAVEFQEINIAVVKAELLSEEGHITVFEGHKEFNLLDLTDARVFAVHDHAPAGEYSKIRLTVSEMELVRTDADGNVIETARPNRPATASWT